MQLLIIGQFITNNYSIREVLAFPFLREDKTAPKEKFAAEVVDVQPLPEEGIRKSFMLDLNNRVSLMLMDSRTAHK